MVYETAEDHAGKLDVEEKVRAMADKSSVEHLQEKFRLLQDTGTGRRRCQNCHPQEDSDL